MLLVNTSLRDIGLSWHSLVALEISQAEKIGTSSHIGADPGQGGGILSVRTPHFWGTLKLHKDGKKTLHACRRIHHVLVVNSYPDHAPLSEILYPPLS